MRDRRVPTPMRGAIVLVLLAAVPPGLGAPDDDATLREVAVEVPVLAEWREHLATHAPTLDYADGAYVQRLRDEDARHVTTHPFVRSVTTLSAAEKLAPDALDGKGPGRYLVLGDPRAGVPRLSAAVESAGGRIHSVSSSARDLVLDAEMGTAALTQLARRGDVRWIEPIREAGLDNARASSIVQSGSNASWPLDEAGINGSTQLVAYCDTGLNTDALTEVGPGSTVHELFADTRPLVLGLPSPMHRKVALYYAPIDTQGLRGDMDDGNGHGTHIAGTLAGDGGASGKRDGNDGVAYAARLAVCDAARGRSFNVLADYSAYWTPAYDAGARIHSNSWGTSAPPGYSAVARQHDAYAFDHPDFLILRSMGNAGPTGDMRAEAAAKNVLAIGATHNDASSEHVEDYSARGPTADGRMKPDLVAPGECVTSSDLPNEDSYACISGTSQATAVAAGAAALVRDYFEKGFYPSGAPVETDAFSPTSALVRATLVASATSVPNASAREQGWGRPQLASALDLGGTPSPKLWAYDAPAALETGGSWQATIEVPSTTRLRFVLAWTDAPAAAGAASAIVNDLDLTIVGPGGSIDSGSDRVNTTERIDMPFPAAGTYEIRVDAWNVPLGPQAFSLIAVAAS